MKNKKMTYLLLVLTVLLWGGVVYRIVSYTGNDSPIPQNSVKESSMSRADTLDFSLKLDYRDPFLNTGRKQEVAGLRKVSNRVMSKSVPVPPAFKYKGLIRNKKKIYAVIDSDGSVETVSKYMPIDGYRILTINPDSLIVEKNGQKYSVKVN
ncbi:hypothetical protein [Bacteroides cellulosilyticus]|uniref:hypothetical protein n=1 Tax=Bacteroides cellulosilyticus TaxID=246787 RepID=UPI00101E0931|nr:hypothetical protein [Bacteroides cellulosilyticus]